LIASKVADKWKKSVEETQSFNEINKKRVGTVRERYGVDNVFSSPEVQKKIAETSQRRYGVSHAMKNEEVFIRQSESAHKGPSEQERLFDEHTCGNVVFTGDGCSQVRKISEGLES
jgi:hypothetical protein